MDAPPLFVGVGMLTPEDLEYCQATHAEIFNDRVRIRHPGRINVQPLDRDLGYEPSDPKPPFYDGPAAVQARPVLAGSRLVVEQAVTTLGYAVKLPVDGTGADEVAKDDIVEVYQSVDPRNLNITLVVNGDESNTFVTARRLSCTVYAASTP